MAQLLPLEIIRALPKTELHCHLDGSMRLSTLLELGKEQGVAMPGTSEAELFQSIYAGDTPSSLEQYLKGFSVTLSVLQTKDALFRAAYEFAEDCANENVRYAEVRYAPTLHTNRGLSLEQIVQAVADGLRAAEKKFDIQTNIILCAIRSMPVEYSIATAKLCLDYKDRGVVAFDLAAGEFGNPPLVHWEAFEFVKKHKLGCTVHAGEALGAESIADAVHECGAQRIGHGTRLYEDLVLLEELNQRQIPLEVCLTSNRQTGAVSNLREHPFLSYYKKGLKVTLNTDNRLVSDTNLTKEFLLAQELFQFGLADFKKVVLNGVESAFVDAGTKESLKSRIEGEFNRASGQ